MSACLPRASFSISVRPSPFFSFPQCSPIAAAVGHPRTLHFLFSINRKDHFLVHHVICYFTQNLTGPQTTFAFCSHIFLFYILFPCVFLPIPPILVSTYGRVLNSLSSKLNLSRYQMSNIGESDTHNYSFPPMLLFNCISTTSPICILKHRL